MLLDLYRSSKCVHNHQLCPVNFSRWKSACKDNISVKDCKPEQLLLIVLFNYFFLKYCQNEHFFSFQAGSYPSTAEPSYAKQTPEEWQKNEWSRKKDRRDGCSSLLGVSCEIKRVPPDSRISQSNQYFERLGSMELNEQQQFHVKCREDQCKPESSHHRVPCQGKAGKYDLVENRNKRIKFTSLKDRMR